MLLIAMTGQQVLATVLFGVFMIGLTSFFMISIMRDRREERERSRG